MKLKEEWGNNARRARRPHINWAKGNWGTGIFPRYRPYCCHRSAFFLELAGGNHRQLSFTGLAAVLVSAWAITGY